MYEVWLNSLPAARHEHVERVVHKHNRALSHHEYAHLVAEVAGGEPRRVARYEEEHVANNVVVELDYHGAVAEVRAPAQSAE